MQKHLIIGLLITIFHSTHAMRQASTSGMSAKEKSDLQMKRLELAMKLTQDQNPSSNSTPTNNTTKNEHCCCVHLSGGSSITYRGWSTLPTIPNNPQLMGGSTINIGVTDFKYYGTAIACAGIAFWLGMKYAEYK